MSRSRGRPTLPETKRKRARNLSVSDTAWKGLEERINGLQIKTISELMEKIGLNQVQVSVLDESPLADIPIYRRLKSLMSDPVAVFWSTLAFVARTCRQFHLEPTHDRVYTVTMKASTIVFYIGYAYPDLPISNSSALIRWLSYRIVQADATHIATTQTGVPSWVAVNPHTIEQCLVKIGNALDVLETAARSPDYEALKMKTIDGLTAKQISRIFKLQGHDVSKVEVATMIKKGLANFRQLFYSDAKTYVPRSPIASERKQAVWETVRYYSELALQETLLNEPWQQDMEDILLKTRHDPYLDFWLNEIDYHLGEQFLSVKQQMAETLERHLQEKKAEIDRELAFCRTLGQIRQTLQTYASKEAGVELSIDRLL
jgi:hypothetical protein